MWPMVEWGLEGRQTWGTHLPEAAKTSQLKSNGCTLCGNMFLFHIDYRIAGKAWPHDSRQQQLLA